MTDEAHGAPTGFGTGGGIAAGAAMKRPGSAMTRTSFGSFASAARIGAQNSPIGMTASV
jgi:hypothetical protein